MANILTGSREKNDLIVPGERREDGLQSPQKLRDVFPLPINGNNDGKLHGALFIAELADKINLWCGGLQDSRRPNCQRNSMKAGQRR